MSYQDRAPSPGTADWAWFCPGSCADKYTGCKAKRVLLSGRRPCRRVHPAAQADPCSTGHKSWKREAHRHSLAVRLRFAGGVCTRVQAGLRCDPFVGSQRRRPCCLSEDHLREHSEGEGWWHGQNQRAGYSAVENARSTSREIWNRQSSGLGMYWMVWRCRCEERPRRGDLCLYV